MRASVVRNWNGSEVVMPNDDLVAGAVTNLTLSDCKYRIEVPVGVGCSADSETVIGLLLEVARAESAAHESGADGSFQRVWRRVSRFRTARVD